MIYNDFSITGIRNNLTLFNQSAQKIASPDNADIIGAEAGVISAVDAVKASIAVLRASDAMQQSLIDILA